MVPQGSGTAVRDSSAASPGPFQSPSFKFPIAKSPLLQTEHLPGASFAWDMSFSAYVGLKAAALRQNSRKVLQASPSDNRRARLQGPLHPILGPVAGRCRPCPPNLRRPTVH